VLVWAGRAGRAARRARIAPDIGGGTAAGSVVFQAAKWPCAREALSVCFLKPMDAAARVMRPRTVWPASHGSRRVKHGMSGLKCHSRPPGLCLMIIVRRRAASSVHDAIRSVARG
jgi:hypothetical protein